MALLTSEIFRIRNELGYNVLQAGAEPYIRIVAIFNVVIQTFTEGGALTTSATAVTAASTPTLVTLTLADGTGFSPGDRVVIDNEAAQEQSTVESVSGNTISLYLSGGHSGTYPVTVEGGETIIREILRKIYQLTAPGGLFEKAARRAGVKKVDEIEFFGGGNGTANGQISTFDELVKLREYWRDELAGTLNVPNMWRILRGGGSNYELY